MDYRKITTRRGGLAALSVPLVIGVLALAPMANAQQEPPGTNPNGPANETFFPVVVTQTPQTTSDLVTDIGNADNLTDPTNTSLSEPPGTLYVIQLAAGVQYQPTETLPLDGNIDIVGPGTYQAQTGADTQINGTQISTTATDQDLFDIEQGAQVEFKDFDLPDGAPSGFSTLNVATDATAELDNVAVSGAGGFAVTNFGYLEANDSLIGGNANLAINGQPGSQSNFINDTIYDNSDGAMTGGGNFALYSSVLGDNDGGAAGDNCGTGTYSFVDVYSDDTTCEPTSENGVTDTTKKKLAFTAAPGFSGGPTLTWTFNTSTGTAGSILINKGDSAYAEPSDQRLFVPTAGDWDVGSWQSTGAEQPTTDTPACTVGTINETPPAFETVNAADRVGLGNDAITTAETDNGTIDIPTQELTVPGATSEPVNTWYELTSPSQSTVAAQDLPTASAFAVEAEKPGTDATAGDTSWTFDATNMLGNTTFCH